MTLDENEEKLLRSVALQNAQAVLLARERAERELRDSKDRITNILESISDAFVVFDKEWRFTYVNPQAEPIVRPLHKGRADLDVLGQSVYDLIAPEFRAQFIEFNESVGQGNKGQVEFQIVGLKGTRRWMEAHAVPMRDPSTNQTVQLAVARDVTSRREAEEKLFRSEEDLRALANSIPQLAWMANPDGEIFWFNRGWFEYTGTTPEQMADSGWKALHDPNMLSCVLERWAEPLAKRNSV
jgi:two-component system, sensor histidine kinase